MKDKVTNTKTGNILFQFQQLTSKTVDKYCSMSLPYQPGLYSIHWESSCRISGLLNDLNESAVQIRKELEKSLPADNISPVLEQVHHILHRSLMQYLEKIYDTDYADAEQPEWMIRIAERLCQNGHFSF